MKKGKPPKGNRPLRFRLGVWRTAMQLPPFRGGALLYPALHKFFAVL